MMNIKKISVVLSVALLHSLLLTSCTGKNNGDGNNSDIPGNSSEPANIEIEDVSGKNGEKPAASKIIYEGDFSGVFANPERGFYKRSEVTERTDFAYVANQDITIVHSYIPVYTYLGLSKDNPWNENVPENLPQILLDNLQSGLDALRSDGLKAIIRPAYAWDWTPPVAEHWAVVKNHIAQINEVISKNADVVMALEAGILGPWGEWHGDGVYTDPDSRKGADFRYELFKFILDTTPDSIPVRLRYPYFIKELLYLGTNPPEGQPAMTQAQMDRIGYHDDSFLVDENDWGSYNPRNVWWGRVSGLSSNYVTNEAQRKWMYEMRTSTGGNILMGGEMEWDGETTIRHENSVPPMRVLTEMADLHTTDISTDYNPKHIDLWRNTDLPASDRGEPAETVYERIERRLGYRLRLIEAELTTAAYAGEEFKITAEICNDGYAGIVKSRPAYIVLDDGQNRYDFLLGDVDVRLWQPGETSFSASFSLPADMPKGAYTIALWLPDAAENLRTRPEYSVRFANKAVWDSKKGYNKLGQLVIL